MARFNSPFRLAAGALVVAGAIVLWRWWPTPVTRGPIVLVSIDTLRADRLPVYGYGKGRTPAIDALARESVIFDRAYAHAPQTLPSHASMFTGLLPFEHGVRDNLGFTLKNDVPVLPELLASAGYRSGGFVSAFVLRADTGIGRGFQTFDDVLPRSGIDRSPGQIQRSGPATLAAATSWMDSQPDQSFVLFLHLYEPHTPYAPPPRFATLEPYDGEIALADEVLGQLVSYLTRRGWYRDSTMIVTSDHGEGLGDHGELEHGLFVYDEAIRVPLLVRLPDGAHGGRRVTEPVQHIDLLPTLARLTGVTAPSAGRGRDLGPLLFGTGGIAAQGIYSEALYPFYHFGWSELLALTDDRYRYIKAPREELYDLDRDPDERANVAGERGQAAAAMRAALEAMVAGRDLDAPSDVSAEDRERLAALGYVGTGSRAAASAGGAAKPDPKDMAPVLAEYRAAIDLLESREFAKAAEAFGTLARKQTDMTDVWLQYAAVLTRLGRHTEALSAYREVVRLKPTEPGGTLGAASALLQLGRLPEAREHARLAVASAPASAHQTLATIAIAARDPVTARAEATRAAAADATLPMREYVEGLIAYAEARYADAIGPLQAAYDAWTRRTAQIPDLRFHLADALARMERYAEAERLFKEEIALFPAGTRARGGLAMLYAATGRMNDVEQVLSDMLTVSPAPATYARAAELWQMFGRPDRAAAIRAKARK